MIDISTFLTTLLNGLTSGMLTFLIAVGLTLIFGVLGVLNFAHGSLYMIGAYFTFLLVSGGYLGGNFWIAAIVGALLVALVGGIIERTIIRPIYDQDHIFQLLLTFALVLVLDNGVRLFWGTDFRSVQVPELLRFRVGLLGQQYPAYNLFLILTGVVVAIIMWLAFERTKRGKIIRAAAQERDIANALGINVPRVFTGMFIIGSALAGFGGALAAPYRTITPTMGESIIIDSFLVVIIGGLGSFAGALVGALLLGIVKSFTFLYFSELQPIIPFVLLAAVILLLPGGIFGGDSA